MSRFTWEGLWQVYLFPVKWEKNSIVHLSTGRWKSSVFLRHECNTIIDVLAARNAELL